MTKLPRHLTADGVIDLGPAELLRGRGFRRAGRNFHRSRHAFVDSVFFQTFRGNPSSFCVNLSLILPYHHEMTRGVPLPGSPSLLNATPLLNSRIRFPASRGKDHWLVVGPEHPAAEVAALVAEHLPEALHFFDAFSSVEQVITKLSSGASDLFDGRPEVDLAVLLAWTGRSQEALALLQSLPVQAVPRGLIDRLADARRPE